MAIKDNPFGVGHSGGDLIERSGRCHCCDLPFKAKIRESADFPRWCEECRHHYPVSGEDLTRALNRLQEHESRLRGYIEAVRRKADEMANEVQECRGQTRASYRMRDQWRAVLAEVRSLHAPAKDGRRCECGVALPCETLAVLDEDTRVKREINTWSYQQLIRDEGPFRDDWWRA